MTKQPEALQYATRLSEMRGGLFSDSAAELRRLYERTQELERYKKAWEEWQEKTDWVQATSRPKELGMHRADVLKLRIQELEASNAQ